MDATCIKPSEHLDARDMIKFKVIPIGVVESSLTDFDAAPRQADEGAPEAVLVLDHAFLRGLEQLQVGDEIVVLTWLHLANRDVLTVHPRGDRTQSKQGVFSTRAEDRPNPIGLHHTSIIALHGHRVRVKHLEAFNGTPIIDVKPRLSENIGLR